MYAKLQELREEREEGFTLIELLVVILIIGILSAIAIPAFLNQRKSAVDSTVASDVTNAAKQVETFVTKAGSTAKNFDGTASQDGTAGPSLEVTTAGVTGTSDATLKDIKVSDGTTVRITGNTFGYCIIGVNAGGDLSNTGVAYASLSGGINKTEGVCAKGEMTTASSTTPTSAEETALETSGQTSSGNLMDYNTWENTDKSYTVTYSYDAATKMLTYTFQFSEPMSGYGSTYFGSGAMSHWVGITVTNGTASGAVELTDAQSDSITHDKQVGDFHANDGASYII